MKTARMVSIAAGLVIATGLIGAAAAQQGPSPGMMGQGMMGPGVMGPGMMSPYGMMGPGMMSGPGRPMCAAMTGHVEGRLAFVKAELKITAAQESLWNAYAAAARDNAKSMLQHCTSMMSHSASNLSLPELLDRREQMMTAQLESVRAMNKALKPLYAAFDDDQKEAADQLFWGHMGMMM